MKKILAAVLAFTIVGFNAFMLLEGTVAKAVTVIGTGSASLEWDVMLDVTSEIALSCTDTSTIDLGTISGMTGGNLEQFRNCNVETNNYAGWELAIHATGSPAMARVGGGDTFADAGAGAWSVGATESEYGFSASSSYPATGFGDNSTYSGFTSTTDILVSEDTASTDLNGADTYFSFRAQAGADRNQMTGDYSSHVVVTATTK